MPLHFHPPSRRSFLRLSVGIGAGLLGGCVARPFAGIAIDADRHAADRDDDHDHWALLSDPHIGANPARRSRGVCPSDHLNTAVAQVLAMDPRPGGVILNGDCARSFGRNGDYRTFRRLLVELLLREDLPLHLTLGNHDHRGRFCRTFAADYPDGWCVDSRIASIIPGRHANLFLLDTLDRTGWLSGTIGDEQLAWLDAALAAHSDRSAIVIGHHPPGAAQLGFLYSLGTVRDSRRLWRTLRRHAHVQAYVFGHTHRWNVTRRDGIYLINLPATSYAFTPNQPTGWVQMSVSESGARLTLRRIGGAQVNGHGNVELSWT